MHGGASRGRELDIQGYILACIFVHLQARFGSFGGAFHAHFGGAGGSLGGCFRGQTVRRLVLEVSTMHSIQPRGGRQDRCA